jgi:hypothetical protein
MYSKMKILCIYSCLYDMKIFARILPPHRLSGNFCYLPRLAYLTPRTALPLCVENSLMLLVQRNC